MPGRDGMLSASICFCANRRAVMSGRFGGDVDNLQGIMVKQKKLQKMLKKSAKKAAKKAKKNKTKVDRSEAKLI